MITRAIIEHPPDVDPHALIEMAFKSMVGECEHMVKAVIPLGPDMDRMSTPMRSLFNGASGRVSEQIEMAYDQVARRTQEELEKPPPSGWRKLFKKAAILFPLAAAAIARIIRPIYDLSEAINYEQFGIRPDLSDLRRLRRNGLIQGRPVNLSEVAFKLGMMNEEYADLNLATQRIGIPAHQQLAVDLLARRGARAVTNLTDSLAHDIGGALEARDADLGRLAGAASDPNRTDVRQALVRAQKDRLGWRRTRSELRRRFGDMHRDWDRIAVTELEDANQTGRAISLAAGPDGLKTRVSRIPRPDACRHCKDLYLLPDGTPRVFVLEDLFEAGSNIGRVASLSGGPSESGYRKITRGDRAGDEVEEYQAVVGQTHPYCRCRLVVARGPA